MTCKPDGTKCDCGPGSLCERRQMFPYHFVAVDSEGRSETRPKDAPLEKYVCGACIPTHQPPIDVSDDDDDEITLVVPNMDERVRALHNGHTE